ncbi:VOC family protein [Sedimentitalea sp. JM2-8]|uniref:VOC family protein n=1 Tax=Sedimentitalea xiamensis TaxID=3050037 RepID=A0ABT7FDF0_9RHOB|nr:VOC family protein [Sedimentitalea xiamensis]MDK3073144.1 VOC family protein [Sedimentitalea xiamensis]
MEQRISLTTLGAEDIEAAAAFYEALGWRRVPSQDGVIAFDLIGQTLALYPLSDLARDMGLPVADLGQGAITLAYNVRSAPEVAEVLATAEAAGATILKAAEETFWGGHAGYFRAPDGAIWEVTFNPFAPLSPDGAFRWNGYG